ncbi:hypothetical protein O6H91_01G090500 [Diphasiastrum complanatum]|uniref:Uncharacterized protein n=1 Tax=Diphasiastrum complanatum TaxID=34168 RepID=A0ACC2ET63_DIPCM|nr:hypothetical protein O6H91_01G090500 [Diphasiastrum complanatum]
MIMSKSVTFMATCLLVLLISVDASTINIKNQCPQTITACSASQSASTACYVLGGGSGSQLIDVGSNWPGGIVWGFPGTAGIPLMAIMPNPKQTWQSSPSALVGRIITTSAL